METQSLPENTGGLFCFASLATPQSPEEEGRAHISSVAGNPETITLIYIIINRSLKLKIWWAAGRAFRL